MSSIQHKLRFLLLAIAAYTGTAQADGHGIYGFSSNPKTNSGSNCLACHLRSAQKPIVTLIGPTFVEAGQTYTYTAVVQGGAGITAGLNVAAENSLGSLQPVSGDMIVMNHELTHSSPKKMIGNKAVFKFNWTAPIHNTLAGLFVSGLSSNGNHDLFGNNAANANLFVKVINGEEQPAQTRVKQPVPVAVQLYADGLSFPMEIAHAKDSRLFILEQYGRIRIIKESLNTLETPFLDLSDRVADGFGLIGLAFHPNYKRNGFFYVHYLYPHANGSYRSRISRFQRGTDPDVANPKSEFIILEYAENNSSEHYGGDLHFGPDGYLYIISGDSNLSVRAQQRMSLLGKLMRIDVDGAADLTNGPDCDISGGRHYRIPPGNVFNDGKKGKGCDEIYATGFRNPWNFSFDRLTGDLWLSDVGNITAEEINFIPAGINGGLNFGWPCYEGFSNGENISSPSCINKSFTFPIHAPLSKDGNASVMGGYVYRGKRYPRLRGQYFFTDFFKASIRSITGTPSNPIVKDVLELGNVVSPVSFGEDYQGELYVLSYNGSVYRIIDPTVPIP